MRKNKKGFTLIELLAVIVILAIIMVIAVPQILNVINNSRKSAWDNHIKLIARSVEANDSILDVSPNGLGTAKFIYTSTSTTSNPPGCDADHITTVADLDTTSSYITNVVAAQDSCTFVVEPNGKKIGDNNAIVKTNGQFTATGNSATKITCTRATGCSYTINSSN